MPDFAQSGPVTTIHDLGTIDRDELESKLNDAAAGYPIGLVLPVTASDMRSEPFAQILDQLASATFLRSIVVVLNRAPDVADYIQTVEMLGRLGDHAQVLWTDGPRVDALLQELIAEDFAVSTPGKGRAVWMAFGYLLADPKIEAYVLHDCDIVDYDREILMRLCLPMAHASLDFDFCKAYYARCTDRMHGRVVRLLVTPLLQALISVMGHDPYLEFLSSFRYPLAGEFAVTARLARSNRIPSDWGLEVGTLAEVYRNASQKRVCQVDLGRLYEHKHQPLSLEDPKKGLMKMVGDILASVVRTLASQGVVFTRGHFISIRAAYMRAAQDAIRQYHADALMNNLQFDRHSEEQAIEGFAELITNTGETVYDDPSGFAAMPTWTRVIAAIPDFPRRLREAAAADRHEHDAAATGAAGG
ncbi:MAG: glycosyl transferase [Planctomycetota bacterium]